MSRFLVLTLVVSILALPALAGQYVIAKVTGIDKSTTYKVLSAEEFKALESQTALEERLYRQAEDMVRKEWKENEATRKDPFPGSAVGAPKVMSFKAFASQEDAQAEMGEREQREQRSADRKAEREKDTTVKKDKEKDARDKMKEQEKEALAQKAADMLEARIKELVDKEKAKASGGTEDKAKANQ